MNPFWERIVGAGDACRFRGDSFVLRLKGGASGVLSHRNDGGHDLLAVAGCVSLDNAGVRHAVQKLSRGPVEVLPQMVREAGGAAKAAATPASAASQPAATPAKQ